MVDQAALKRLLLALVPVDGRGHSPLTVPIKRLQNLCGMDPGERPRTAERAGARQGNVGFNDLLNRSGFACFAETSYTAQRRSDLTTGWAQQMTVQVESRLSVRFGGGG